MCEGTPRGALTDHWVSEGWEGRVGEEEALAQGWHPGSALSRGRSVDLLCSSHTRVETGGSRVRWHMA